MIQVKSIKLTATLKGQLVAHLRFTDNSDAKMLVGGPAYLQMVLPLRSEIVRKSHLYIQGLDKQLNKLGDG